MNILVFAINYGNWDGFSGVHWFSGVDPSGKDGTNVCMTPELDRVIFRHLRDRAVRGGGTTPCTRIEIIFYKDGEVLVTHLFGPRDEQLESGLAAWCGRENTGFFDQLFRRVMEETTEPFCGSLSLSVPDLELHINFDPRVVSKPS